MGENLVVRIAREVQADRRSGRKRYYSDVFAEACETIGVPESDRTDLSTKVLDHLRAGKEKLIAETGKASARRKRTKKKVQAFLFRRYPLPG